MNARVRTVACSTLILMLAGCTSAPIVGTWTGRDSSAQTPFTFGSVSFVGDHTFTAEARYSGETRVQSGSWETEGNNLSLQSGETQRAYTYAIDGNALVVTDPKSGHSITLDRMAK